MIDLIGLQKIADQGNSVVDHVPESVYHAFPAMSASGLKEFKKGPGYWKWMRDHPSDEDTQARLEGRLVHMALAEPERFARQVCVVEGHRGGTAVKEQVAAAKAQGLTVCKPADFDMARRVLDFCRKHPLIKELLRAGKGEQTMLWKDPATGAQCKARADFLTPSQVIADFKTFDPIYSDDEIERQCRKMQYHWQAAWYLEGYLQCTGQGAKGFYNVFIRTEDPIDARVVEIAPQSIDEVMPYIRQHLAVFAECVKSGAWPLSAPEVSTIVMKPFWN